MGDDVFTRVIAEYIWIDGTEPTKKLRSKLKIFTAKEPIQNPEEVPVWSFDGSSTQQAEGGNSDVFLKPVRIFHDPIRRKYLNDQCILVLCETFNDRLLRLPHASNTRATLGLVAQSYERQKPLFGIEQEYTLYDAEGGRPFRWPNSATAFPGPQGRYYCGVGADEVYGRQLVEAHLEACLGANILISGINAEVMPAQWEFQIGPLPPLEMADQLWVARWLLYRIGEEYGISAKLTPKPVDGDWNGTGAHTNFSTEKMRKKSGLEAIKHAAEKIGAFHAEHIGVYGVDNEKRLTGKHETCSIREFRWGIADRGASVRIPKPVAEEGRGYLEDRRPAANADPYEVLAALLETVCGNGFRLPPGRKPDVKL